MEHGAWSKRSEVGCQKSDDRRQKRAELVEEWSIMSNFGLRIGEKPEDRGAGEDRRQTSEGSKKSEVGSQRSEVGDRRSEDYWW